MFFRNLFFTLTLLTFTSCINVFDPLDSPSGDAQILSAARACFDQGDITCAINHYQELSNSDTAKMELSLAELNQAGIDMGTFMTSFATGGSGPSLTALANALVSRAGSSLRADVFQAYQRISTISDTNIKNLTKFLTAIAMSAEILAETASAATPTNSFTQTDLVTTPTSCSTNPLNCSAPSGGLTGGPTLISNPTALSSVSVDLSHFATFINEAITGLVALSPQGKFSSGIVTVLNALFSAPGNPLATAAFLQAMIQQHIGE